MGQEDLIRHFQYCVWRLELWSLNYGSYDQIDQDVRDGKLTPGIIPDRVKSRKDITQKTPEK